MMRLTLISRFKLGF